MKKIFLITLSLMIAMVMFTGCEHPKIMDINGTPTEVKPYGWINEDSRKIDGVIYEVSANSVILSIVFSETIIIPNILTGTELFVPVRVENKKAKTPSK